MKTPKISARAFVAPGATVLGDVTVHEGACVLYGAVVRGDNEPITIGRGSNIQDGCILHMDPGHPVTVGEGCTVGHGAILHGCTIGDNTLVGMGATILDGAVIGRDCLVGAGALVTSNVHIPDGSMVLGAPAKVVRPLRAEEIEANRQSALHYQAEFTAEPAPAELMLSVIYTARPGQRETFVRTLVEEGIVSAIRAEDGCLMYDYYFSAQDEDTVLLVERWTSEEHQRRHMQQPHMARLKEIKERYIAETALHRVHLD